MRYTDMPKPFKESRSTGRKHFAEGELGKGGFLIKTTFAAI